MSWEKEKPGQVNISASAAEVFRTPHSPEEEKRLLALIEEIRPMLLQGVRNELTNYFIDNSVDGDITQHIYNIVNNYIRNLSYTLGQFLKPGKGIEFDWPGYGKSAVSVRAGKGLEAAIEEDLNVELTTNGGLEFSGSDADATLQVQTGEGIMTDSGGVSVDTDGTNQFDTAHRATGCGLSFAVTTEKLRVKPLDFLYTAADVT